MITMEVMMEQCLTILLHVWHGITAVLLRILEFAGLWIVYWFGLFMLSCILLVVTNGRIRLFIKRERDKTIIDFWVCFWFGFMCTVVHSIIWLLAS